MPVRIKVCGITSFDDARVAASVGADALGFIFHRKSPRFIAPADARDIIRRLPPFVTAVGVFVDAPLDSVQAIRSSVGIDVVQLHGSESPGYVAQLGCRSIKAFSVGPEFNAKTLNEYPAQAILLDTWSDAARGGTGKTFDWAIARKAVDTHTTVILAGGLGPTNLAEALDQVRPWGVDINSGVEIRPGVKNPQKVRAAITLVRNWK